MRVKQYLESIVFKSDGLLEDLRSYSTEVRKSFNILTGYLSATADKCDRQDKRLANIYGKIEEVNSDLCDESSVIQEKIREISGNLKSTVDDGVASVRYELRTSEKEIMTKLDNHHEANLSMYEDLSEISLLTKKVEKAVGEMSTVVSGLNNRAEHAIKVNDLQKEIKYLTEENSRLMAENQALSDKVQNLEYDVSSLTDSFAVVVQGVYNQENIEFAAVKTYRGWRYLCYNGRQITNFDDISDMRLDYKRGENLHMDMSFEGE